MKILQLLLLLLLSWSPHQLVFSFVVKITIKWKIPKDRGGVAGTTIPLAVSLLVGEGKTLTFLRQTLRPFFRSEVFTNKYHGATCIYVVFILWRVFCFLVNANSWIKSLSSHLYLIVKWAHHSNMSILWPFLPWWQKTVFKVSAEMYFWEQDAEQLCVKKPGSTLTGEHFFLPSYKAVLINNTSNNKSWAFILNSESTGLGLHFKFWVDRIVYSHYFIFFHKRNFILDRTIIFFLSLISSPFIHIAVIIAQQKH